MKTFFVIVSLVLLAACAVRPFSVSSDFDREIDYSGYESYAWVSENPMVIPEGSSVRPSPLTERRIMDRIETEMELRGYSQADAAENADFVIGFTIGTREKLDVQSYPTPVGFNPWGYPYGWNYPYGWGSPGVIYTETTRTRQYTEGTLSIDIFDVEKRRPVWHGKAQGVIRDRSVEEHREIEAQAIQEILATFPPL